MECIFLLVFNSDTKFQMHPYPVKSFPGKWKRKKKKNWQEEDYNPD